MNEFQHFHSSLVTVLMIKEISTISKSRLNSITLKSYRLFYSKWSGLASDLQFTLVQLFNIKFIYTGNEKTFLSN